MPARMLHVSYAPKDYAVLPRCVRQTMFAGQAAIAPAWVRTSHDTGRLIASHILAAKRAVSQLAAAAPHGPDSSDSFTRNRALEAERRLQLRGTRMIGAAPRS